MLTVSTIGFLAFLQTAVFVVGYISNNNLFPEPLTQDEEKMYLDEIQELITKYNKLVDDEIKIKEQELMQV